MDRKIIGMGIGAVLVISLVAIMGFALAQGSENKVAATGFVDADNDGVCDNAANCPMHQNKGGCHGSEGCPMMKEGFKGGCHRIAAE